MIGLSSVRDRYFPRRVFMLLVALRDLFSVLIRLPGPQGAADCPHGAAHCPHGAAQFPHRVAQLLHRVSQSPESPYRALPPPGEARTLS
jgi:hypothetical protein